MVPGGGLGRAGRQWITKGYPFAALKIAIRFVRESEATGQEILSILARPRDILTPMKYRLALAVLVCAALLSFADDGGHAPLPQKLVAAKTVFLQNDSGEQGFSDAVFMQLKEWGRWRVVANRTEADVVITLDHKDNFSNNVFYLRVLDRESGEALWTAKKDAAIRIWNRVARILMADLRKRLPPSHTGMPDYPRPSRLTLHPLSR